MLVVSFLIVPTAKGSPVEYEENTLYVDNDWIGGSRVPSELSYGDNAFASIENAVDNADSIENNRIIVESGLYEEDNIAIDVENLVMESRNNYAVTTVKSPLGYDVFLIEADNVTIDGFTLESATGHVHTWDSAGVYLDNVTNTTIRNNFADNNESGIYLDYSSNNKVVNNVANTSQRGHYGILLYRGSHNNLVENNLVENSGLYGIRIRRREGKLKNNVIRNNITGKGIAVGFGNPENTTIENNLVRDSRYGIRLLYSEKGLIKNNTVKNSERSGIQISGSNNTIVKNVIEEGGIDARSDNLVIDNNILSSKGIFLRGVGRFQQPLDNILISNNTIENIEGRYGGIYIYSSNNVDIENNLVENCGSSGILLRGGFENVSVLYNVIRKNEKGIHIDGSKENVNVNWNNIYNNSSYGVYYETSENIILNAENNWWGDNNGPSGVGLGNGDAVSPLVDFDPWLDASDPQGNPVEFDEVYGDWLVGFKQGIISPETDFKFDATEEASTEIAMSSEFSGPVNVAEYQVNVGGSIPEGTENLGKYVKIYLVQDWARITSLSLGADLKIHYTDSELSDAGIENEELLGLYYWNEDANTWVFCPETSVNTENNFVYARVYHLTTFAPMTMPSGAQGPAGPQGPKGPQGPEGPEGPPGTAPEEIEELESRIENLKSELKEREDLIDDQKQEIEELESEIENLSSQLEGKIQDLREKVNTEIENLEQQFEQFLGPASSPGYLSIPVGGSQSIGVDKTRITNVTVEAEREIDGSITVQSLKQRPEGVVKKQPLGSLYQYVMVSSENVVGNMKSASIEFQVEKDWLEEEKIDKNSIQLARYDRQEDEWTGFDSEKVGEDGSYIYYETEVPSLSIFAITGSKTGAFPWMWVGIGIAIAIVIIAGVLFTKKRANEKSSGGL